MFKQTTFYKAHLAPLGALGEQLPLRTVLEKDEQEEFGKEARPSSFLCQGGDRRGLHTDTNTHNPCDLCGDRNIYPDTHTLTQSLKGVMKQMRRGSTVSLEDWINIDLNE